MIIIKVNNKDQELNEIKCTYIKIIELNEMKMYVH